MGDLIALIVTHRVALAIFAFGSFSSAVDALPEPMPSSGTAYRWLYRFAHGFALNLVTAFGRIGRTPWPGETPSMPQQSAQPRSHDGEEWSPPAAPGTFDVPEPGVIPIAAPKPPEKKN
jgi:hypothetical protein